MPGSIRMEMAAARVTAERLVHDLQCPIRMIAKALLDRERLSGAEVEAIYLRARAARVPSKRRTGGVRRVRKLYAHTI